MEAYNSNNAIVNKKIVLKAASQALGDDLLPPTRWLHKNIKIGLVVSSFLLVLIIGFWFGRSELSILVNTDLPENAVKEVIASPSELKEIGTIKSDIEQTEKLNALNLANKVNEPIVKKSTEQAREQKVISVKAKADDAVPNEPPIVDNYKVEAVSKEFLMTY